MGAQKIITIKLSLTIKHWKKRPKLFEVICPIVVLSKG